MRRPDHLDYYRDADHLPNPLGPALPIVWIGLAVFDLGLATTLLPREWRSNGEAWSVLVQQPHDPSKRGQVDLVARCRGVSRDPREDLAIQFIEAKRTWSPRNPLGLEMRQDSLGEIRALSSRTPDRVTNTERSIHCVIVAHRAFRARE